jgi:hypothetical protein
MVTPMARQPASSPAFTPLPYGLFSVANFPSETDLHWMNGIIHRPDTCDPAGSTLNPCPSTDKITKAPSTTGIGKMGADPFAVYSFIMCGPVGNPAPEFLERGRRALENGGPRAVESVFWTGSVSTTGSPLVMPHLAEDAQTVGPQGEISQLAASPVTTGAAVSPIKGLGMIEGALADCYGGVGVIHVPRTLIPHLDGAGVIHRNGDQLVTANGNLVAAGAGYPGTAPDGSEPLGGQVWIYATGSIDIRRGPVNQTPYQESVNMAENSLVIITEQTYVITWDCCLFAAQITLGS